MAEVAYSPMDVAEVLGRLSAVAAGKALAFPQGSLALSPEDLQAQWQVVASTGGQVEAGGAIEHLRAVYQYIENVIISCGAPDSFDVYEVCFEALTKIASAVHGPAPKELLLHVLEDVHEVYDVLLSCVETYEWVQPGATGLLRLWMLQVVFFCFGSTAIAGRDLMELTDNDISGTVGLISFILRCEQAPFEMQSTAGRCLVELTTADSVFLSQSDQCAADWQNQQIAKLTAMLNRHVNGLIKAMIQFDVVEAFGRCICQHQMSHSRTDIIVKFFLTTIHNCLLYCSENQKKLRQHLATQSTIVQDIMIPYVLNILPALYDSPGCGPQMIEWQNLKSVLQTFVVVTFNINVFRPQLRDGDMLLKVCEVPNVLTHISLLELLIKLCINVEFNKGPYYEPLLNTISNAFAQLPAESQARLQRRLTSESSMRLPYSTASQARQALAFAITPPAGEEAQEPEAVASRKANRKNRWRNAKNKARKRKGLYGMQRAQKRKDGAPAAATEADDEEEDDSDDDDMPPLIPAEGWDGALGPSDEAGVPCQAKCQLSGQLMHDPVSTPEGHVFERAALEDWATTYGTNPISGAPLNVADCQEAKHIHDLIQGYQLQTISACYIAPYAFDEPPAPPEISAPVPAPAPVLPGPSHLGDLPSLEQEKKAKKEKNKIRIESRSVVDCPDDMRCAIDGKVMINPVRSPYGHCFEKKTLDKWVMNCGSCCPVTQKPLRLEDCAPDSEMKKRIAKFLKGQ